MAPLPAKRSKKRAFGTLCAHILKTDCLSLSEVGLVTVPFGASRVRFFNKPPVILIDLKRGGRVLGFYPFHKERRGHFLLENSHSKHRLVAWQNFFVLMHWPS